MACGGRSTARRTVHAFGGPTRGVAGGIGDLHLRISLGLGTYYLVRASKLLSARSWTPVLSIYIGRIEGVSPLFHGARHTGSKYLFGISEWNDRAPLYPSAKKKRETRSGGGGTCAQPDQEIPLISCVPIASCIHSAQPHMNPRSYHGSATARDQPLKL